MNTAPMFRIGEGWDSHRLVEGRPLVLGGVTIPHTHGLFGHSDADALCHAVTDALFGAAAMGDIGHHFPDTDERFRGADSLALLAEAARRVRAQGWSIVNVDSTIVAQTPKLAPHMAAINAGVAKALGVPDRIIMFRHVLPNAMVATLTFLPFILAGSVTTLTSLDFLGLGVPPGTPSLGELLAQGKANLDAWWITLSTFALLVTTLLLLTFMGDALRDALDPRKADA